MKITKYGQSAILIENYKDKRILIDPGSYCFVDTGFAPEDFGKIDILLYTHVHSDHCVLEAAKIIKDNNPNLIIIGNSEVKDKLSGLNCDSINPGETRKIEDIEIKGIKQEHGDLPSGDPKPDNIGFLIDGKFYHTGDSIYVEDKPQAEVLFVPICGTVVMDINDAVKFSKEVNAKLIIPIHYDNLKYPADPNEFVKVAEGLNVKVLKFGESIEL